MGKLTLNDIQADLAEAFSDLEAIKKSLEAAVYKFGNLARRIASAEEEPKGIRIGEAQRSHETECVILKGPDYDPRYFSMFVDSKPSWSINAWCARFFKTQEEALECLQDIKELARANGGGKGKK